eukprot:1120574-Rhodomonas_salina.1
MGWNGVGNLEGQPGGKRTDYHDTNLPGDPTSLPTLHGQKERSWQLLCPTTCPEPTYSNTHTLAIEMLEHTSFHSQLTFTQPPFTDLQLVVPLQHCKLYSGCSWYCALLYEAEQSVLPGPSTQCKSASTIRVAKRQIAKSAADLRGKNTFKQGNKFPRCYEVVPGYQYREPKGSFAEDKTNCAPIPMDSYSIAHSPPLRTPAAMGT